jgi:hypothetical protein
MATRRGLPPEIQDLDDYTESKNILVYGGPGSGKTRMGGQLPNCLLIAGENGAIAAKRGGSKAKIWKMNHWNDILAAYKWLQDNPGVFDWVLFDSITNVQNRCIRAIMETVVKQNKSRDPHIPAQGDHFKWQLVMKEMINDWCELPINVFWTAQEMVRENPDGDDIILPLIEGKDYQIAAWVCAQMHVVANLQLRKVRDEKTKRVKVVRRLIVNESPPYYAKDRYDCLGRYIDDPDINAIIRKIDDSETGRPARRTAPRKAATRKTTTTRRRTSA